MNEPFNGFNTLYTSMWCIIDVWKLIDLVVVGI